MFFSNNISKNGISSSWDHLSYGGYVGSFIFDKFIVHLSEVPIVSVAGFLFFISLSEAIDIPFKFYRTHLFPMLKNMIKSFLNYVKV